MKPVAQHLSALEKELQERMMWINSAAALMGIVLEYGLNEESKKIIRELIKKAELE